MVYDDSQNLVHHSHFLRHRYLARRSVASSSTTAENVLDVLLLFDATRPELTADEIGRLIGAPRSTTYRYIRTLRAKGLLERTERDSLRLGPRMMQFSAALRQQRDVGSIALPHMEALARETRETVLLTRRSNQYAVCVERVEGSHAVRITFDRGHIQPLHAGASSKILLAHVPPERLEAYLLLPLHAYTAATVTDMATLQDQLAQIRAQGYCVTEGEVDEGAVAVAVPIKDGRGQPVAGLSTAGPSFRMGDEVVAAHLALLRPAATAIGEQLARSGL